MAGHYRLFRDIHQCPVCNRPLRKEECKTKCPTGADECAVCKKSRQREPIFSKVCPIGHIRFKLQKTTQRWYLSIEVPKSRIRIKETGELFETCKAVAVHIHGQPSAVNECLHGKRKQHKGYTFEFADDEWEE